MRIAIFSYADPAIAGGVQEATYQLAEALERRGHRVVIYGPAGKRALPYRAYRAACHSLTVPLPNGNWTNITVPFATSPSVSSHINHGRFDILHIQDPWVPLVSWDLVNHVRVPMVATFNTAWEGDSPSTLLSSIMPNFQAFASRAMAAATYVSRQVARCWQPLFTGKVLQEVIYYGVDPMFYETNSLTKSGDKLLFVARLVTRKGLLYLLEAVKMLKSEFPKLRLDVLGEGPERGKCEAFVRSHQLNPMVSFHGSVPGRGKLTFFQRADIFCAPYRDEAFGLTVLEAMAVGLPIVGFDNQAFSEILKSYPRRKLFLGPKDAVRLAKAIRLLLRRRQLRQELSRWAVAESKKYTWEKTSQQVENLYFQVLARRSGERRRYGR